MFITNIFIPCNSLNFLSREAKIAALNEEIVQLKMSKPTEGKKFCLI